MHSTVMSRSARLADHAAASSALSSCGDDRLRELVDAGTAVGAGIGGQTLLLDVGGVPVFVKRVRLTDLERRPENVRSTANLFDLPRHCHYGVGVVGSPGFGAWRELAVHELTTGWVVAGEHEGFPLLHHWRLLEDDGHPLPAELAHVDEAVARWGGGPGIRRRLEELETSSASLVLFLEHLPHTLHDWLATEVAAGDEAAVRACAMVDRELREGIAFVNGRGLLHLDVHFENVLTDGDRLYLADFGLAVAAGFGLAPAEADFLAEHRDYDRAYAATHLVNWLAVALHGADPDQRWRLVAAWAEGVAPADVPAPIGDLLLRDAPVAAVMGDFYRRFQQQGPQVPYPRAAVAGALPPT